MVTIGGQNRIGIIFYLTVGGVCIFLRKMLLLLVVIISTMIIGIAVSAFTIDTDKNTAICLFVNNKNGKVVSVIKRAHQNVAEIAEGLKKGGYEQVEELPKNATLDVQCSVIVVHDVVNPLVQCKRPWEQSLVSQVFDSTKNTTLRTSAGRKKIGMQCPYYGNLSETIDQLRNKVRARQGIYFSA